jgi:hypothetical protein
LPCCCCSRDRALQRYRCSRLVGRGTKADQGGLRRPIPHPGNAHTSLPCPRYRAPRAILTGRPASTVKRDPRALRMRARYSTVLGSEFDHAGCYCRCMRCWAVGYRCERAATAKREQDLLRRIRAVQVANWPSQGMRGREAMVLEDGHLCRPQDEVGVDGSAKEVRRSEASPIRCVRSCRAAMCEKNEPAARAPIAKPRSRYEVCRALPRAKKGAAPTSA